jgi:quercetin dioxygenase-like cupin family protein
MTNQSNDDDNGDPAAPSDELWSLLAGALAPEAPEPRVRDALLAQLRGKERWAPFASEIARAFSLDLEHTRAALARLADQSSWQPGFWPGSWFSSTAALQQARTVIARLPAGTRIPAHRHVGRELTYILDGELIEDDRTPHGSGALLDMPPGSRHEVAVSANGECMVVFSLPAA